MGEGSLTFRVLRRPAIAALLIGALTLTACGESSQEKAKAEVCGARNEISKQITKLEGLTLSASSLTEAKTGFEAIGKELTKIKNAQPKLSPERKQQVQAATESFGKELSTLAGSVAGTLGSGNLEAVLKNAGPQVKSALEKLSASYKSALAPINCS
jgi:Tfp pilus assembly protein PilP